MYSNKHADLLSQAARSRQVGNRRNAALFLHMAKTERLVVTMEKKYARQYGQGFAVA
ncbi:MAG: hypothetical protein ACRC4K_02195 [Plesiomonas shigelloides]